MQPFETEVAGFAAQTESRTFCLIIYPQGTEDRITGILDVLGVPGYTQSEKVTGRGPRGRHFDTYIWPGADGSIFTVTSPTQATRLTAALQQLGRSLERESNGLYGIHVFTWDCQQAL